MFLNSHNVNSNSNQNHANTGTHRSRKEKLICRSIVTNEPISLPVVEAPPPVEVVPLNRHGRVYVGGSSSKSPGQRCPSGVQTHIVKIKTPRKPKVIPTVVGPSNGTSSYEDTIIPPSPTVTAKLPKRMRIEVIQIDGSPTSCNVNGITPNPITKTPSPKSRKEKKEKVPKVRENNGDKPKRKYTKRKNLDGRVTSDLIPDPLPNIFADPLSILKLNPLSKPGDIQWAYPPRPTPLPPTADYQRIVTDRSLFLNQPATPGDPGRKNFGLESGKRDMREPTASNTHLLLSPQTLKRMLRSPSPATQNSTLNLSEEELDDEIIQVSNSLFKDMSLNRQQKFPSPESSYTSSCSTTSSSPHGRGRYSRRKFGRLYPPFDPNHCCHPHCLESTLTGLKYCGSHVNGNLVKPPSTAPSVYGQCTYTDPLSLKPCKQTVYGEDDREFRFCDAHSARVTSTRLRVHRRELVKEKEGTMDSLLDELEDCVSEGQPGGPSASATSAAPEVGGSPATPASPGSEDKEREELLKDFLNELDARPPHHSKNLRLFSRFQPDQDSDEDIGEIGEDDPLKHAGYYSTDEVISIYRSRLVKLRSLYQSQFSVLRNAYMEYRHRCVEETDKNELQKFSFTCDPKFIGVHNRSVETDYKEQQVESRERSLALMKYHHRFGPKQVVQLQAMQEYETQKTEPRARVRKESETEIPNSGEGDSDDGCESENPYTFMQSMNQMEANKRMEKSNTSNTNHLVTSEAVDMSKRSLSSTYAPFSSKYCIFRANSDSPQCTSLPLPLSQFCKFHILNDTDQTLVINCGRVLGDTKDVCPNPIIKGFQKGGCKFHRLAEVSEPKPSQEDVERMKQDTLGFGFAESEEEQEVLEELVARETFNMNHFDRAVKYLNEKGFVVPDTDESDTGEDEEEEEFKNLLHEELLQIGPPKVIRKTKGKPQKKTEPSCMSEELPPLEVKHLDTALGDSTTTLRYLPLLPEIKEDPLDDPEPCLVLNPAE